MPNKYPLLRFVVEFDKITEDFLRECEVKNLEMDFLRELFDIDPNDIDEVNRDVAYCYEIHEKQAEALQPYVSFKIDLNKFDYMFESRGDYSFKNSK